MFRIVKSETVPLTRELAAEFAALPKSPSERVLDPKRIKKLRDKVIAGRVLPFNWATVQVGDDIFRMNGQHSSTMLCELNGAFPKEQFVHRDYFEADSLDSAGVLFGQFDARLSVRTRTDFCGFQQGRYPELLELPRPGVKEAAEGYRFFMKTVEGLPVPGNEDEFTVLADNHLRDFARWVVTDIFPNLPVTRPGVVACIYATTQVSEDAKLFWHRVAEPIEEGHAQILHDWLEEVGQGDVRRKGDKPLWPKNLWQGCSSTWNNFRLDAKPQKVKFELPKGGRLVAVVGDEE